LKPASLSLELQENWARREAPGQLGPLLVESEVHAVYLGADYCLARERAEHRKHSLISDLIVLKTEPASSGDIIARPRKPALPCEAR
jgi:hypothetical protein